MPTTSSAPPELDALVRAAVAARLAILDGSMTDRARAADRLYPALMPFVGAANLDGDVEPEVVRVRIPAGFAALDMYERPAARRVPAPQDSSYKDGYSPGVKRAATSSADAMAARDKPGRSRWQTNSGAFRGLTALPVPVRGGWKVLGECDHSDLAQVVDHYTNLAGRNQRRAQQFTRLLAVLLEQEEDTVGDLPTELIEGALHG